MLTNLLATLTWINDKETKVVSGKYQLTPVEHELMEILWILGQGTVRDVLAHLPNSRKLAYTSVSTILRILQQKKILTAKENGSTTYLSTTFK